MVLPNNFFKPKQKKREKKKPYICNAVWSTTWMLSRSLAISRNPSFRKGYAPFLSWNRNESGSEVVDAYRSVAVLSRFITCSMLFALFSRSLAIAGSVVRRSSISSLKALNGIRSPSAFWPMFWMSSLKPRHACQKETIFPQTCRPSDIIPTAVPATERGSDMAR